MPPRVADGAGCSPSARELRLPPLARGSESRRTVAETLRTVTDRLRGPTTLERVLAWAAAERPARRIAPVVTQDEFTHDGLVPIEPPLWLAFDVT